MRGFLSYDGALSQGIRKLVDIVLLSVLWLVSCLPVITIGAASAALYYSVHTVIKYDRGSLFKSYFLSFRTNFKQATIVWLLLLGIYYLLGVSIYSTFLLHSSGQPDGWTYLMPMIATALVTVWAIYLFPSIARFENKTLTILKNSLIIAVIHFGASVLLLLILIAVVAVVLFIPALVMLIPVAYMYFSGFVLEAVFRRYMSQEEREAEASWNIVKSEE